MKAMLPLRQGQPEGTDLLSFELVWVKEYELYEPGNTGISLAGVADCNLKYAHVQYPRYCDTVVLI